MYTTLREDNIMPEFREWPSISRLSREMIITEKLDGTNAQVMVAPGGTVYAGSRTRWITPEDDNYGFARWVRDHEDELRTGLGIGTHYGEWWGSGIQRKYTTEEKRFSLFNVRRWTTDVIPACCHIVPTLYRGTFDTNVIDNVLTDLANTGSIASPRFMNPEGIVIYHVASKTLFKKTLDKNDGHKGVYT